MLMSNPLGISDDLYSEVQTKLVLQMRAVEFFIFFIDFSSFKLRFLWILHFQKFRCISFLLHFK